jgi:nitrite reductase/ring-hydroxylating ferredoxin subunit
MSDQASIDRRAVLQGIGAAGAAVVAGGLIAGCGSEESATVEEPPPSPESADPGGSGGGSGGDAEVLTSTADVAEGGGVILEDAEVVVTQPTAGEFVAFSSICTHQGCPVSEIAGGTINCPCHGSQFSIEDGSVVAGPAPSPLPAVDVVVEGDSVVRA